MLHDLELADVPKVLEGVVENYLAISYTDPSLTRTAAAAERLSCHDAMDAAIFSKGHFGLTGYAKTTVTAVHTLCSVPALRETIAFPRTEREMRARRTASMGAPRLAPAMLGMEELRVRDHASGRSQSMRNDGGTYSAAGSRGAARRSMRL